MGRRNHHLPESHGAALKEKYPCYALPPRCFLVSPAALVGRIDHFCSRNRCIMPEGVGNRWGTCQTCRAEQQERIEVASGENFVVWAPFTNGIRPGT